MNKFYVADTGDNHLDGKVGLITSYDFIKCCFRTRIRVAHQMRNSDFIDLSLSTANMEPYTRVDTPTHVPHPSAETCTIKLGNHFSGCNHVVPCVTFHADVFNEIGGITASPHTGGQAQHDRLVELIKTKELMKHSDAEKNTITASRVEKGLVKAVCYLLS